MSSDCHTPSPRSPTVPPLASLAVAKSPDPELEDDAEQDQLAFTIDFSFCPQLQLFKNVFNTGKPLASYCHDDPLWPPLASSSCTNCLKAPDNCKVLPGSPRCTNGSAKKTFSLGKILHYWYFARWCNQDIGYSRRFLELHGTSLHQAAWDIPFMTWQRYNTLCHALTTTRPA
ncbi:hypothetical protein EV368DRAFT_89449 [Lentinula lateritia]|nr:hypothetical protein EV368DRAFT_89449 [Lentinula lateritia]